MKKKSTLFILFLILTPFTLLSQPWHYDFGTGTGSYSTSGGISTTFLPTPPNGNTITRIGSGSGSVNLVNQIIPFGVDTYIRAVAPTGTSVNKFGLNNYSPGKSFTYKFLLRLGASDGSGTGSSNGIWYFFAGDGTTYGDGSSFAGAQVFTGFRFRFGTNDSLFFSFRNKSIWDSVTVPKTYFKKGQTYVIEIYGNNTLSPQTYTYSSLESLDSNKWDLWVDGIKFGNDLSKALLANDANIDSWMFYGESSTSNLANIFIDEFDYHNDLAGTPLPVTLGSFTIRNDNRSVKLNWSTLNELNNAGFEIERSSPGAPSNADWRKIAYVSGFGITNEPRTYSYEDKNLQAGKYSYRLKQIDYNGNFEYFTPSNNSVVDISKPGNFTISQNYPNPSNPLTKIDYEVPFESFVNISVYDVTGRVVKELVNENKSADYYNVTFDGSDLASGVYFYRISAINNEMKFSKTMKMLLVK